MRRFWILLLLVLCLTGFWCNAQAASGVTSAQLHAQVLEDGSAQLRVTVHLHLEQGEDSLTFPIPTQAENVLLGGVQARTYIEEGVARVLLPSMPAGDNSFEISYRLPRVANLQTQEKEKEPKLYLELPLLSGFSYPVDALELTVILPGSVPGRPGFFSGYHQQGIESSLDISWQGNTITATSTAGLKDHETLQLRMQVPESLLPQLRLHAPSMSAWEAAALVSAVLAVVYYLLCLLPVFPRQSRCFSPPEGISAGEVGTCLTGRGIDLTMLVFSWAQLGYIRMELTHKNKVTLIKRMDMGNERSAFEGKVFRALFQGRQVVAGASYHYARMCRKVATASPLRRQLFRKGSGDTRIFRLLAGISGGLSGVCMAVACTQQTAAQVLLGILLGLLCSVLSYWIQSGSYRMPLGESKPMYVACGCGALWLIVGLLLGCFWLALVMTLFQLAVGMSAAYGGKRTERGKRCLGQLRSLRSFMVSTPSAELQRMLRANPSYFYELAPYALAMGVDRQFARKFGRMVLPDCSFLVTSFHRELTAVQLMRLMHRTADSLNALQRRLPYEQLRGRG